MQRDITYTMEEYPATKKIFDILKVNVENLLRRSLDSSEITIGFFELGFDSIILIQFVDLIEYNFGVRPSNSDIVNSLSTLSALTDFIATRLPDDWDIQKKSSYSSQTSNNDNNFSLPLANLQQAYWLGRQGIFELGDVSPHAWFEYQVKDIDIPQLERAWNKLVIRHDMLRSVIISDVEQQILPSVPYYSFNIHDVSSEPEVVAQDKLTHLRKQISTSLDVDFWPLFNITVCNGMYNVSNIFVSFDLVILDGRSFKILLDEWCQIYNDLSTSLPNFKSSFRDHLIKITDERSGEAWKTSMAYWQKRLSTLPMAPDLPQALPTGQLRSYAMTHHHATVPATTWKQFCLRASEQGLTPSSAICSVFTDILRGWSKNWDFTLNILVERRSALPLVYDLVGSFTTTLLLEVSGYGTFVGRAQSLQKQLWEDLEHIRVSGVEVLRELNHQKARSGVAAMPVVFSSELGFSQVATSLKTEAFLGKLVNRGVLTPYVLLDHQIREIEGELILGFDVVESAYPAGFINLFIECYLQRVIDLAENKEKWFSSTTDILPSEDKALLAKLNDTVNFSSTNLLYDKFIFNAKAMPLATAVIDKSGEYSYEEIAKRARKIAKLLTVNGVIPGQLVAITMAKGWEQIVAVLGIHFVGAAYVPIDPSLPEERIGKLLEACQVRIILTQCAHRKSIIWPKNTRQLSVSQYSIGEETDFLPVKHDCHDLAYVIFTSGSTGEPKGVMIDHLGAVNTIEDINRRFSVSPRDSVLAISSLSFDLSVYDIYGLLSTGGTIVIPDHTRYNDPSHWYDLIVMHGITLWNSVPALFDIYVEFVSNKNASLSSLRLALLSGDWISTKLPGKAYALSENIDIVSLGGATEASIWSVMYKITRGVDYDVSIPYGKALTNQKIVVLNKNLEPCPVNVSGDIYIGGVGITKGYWRDPEMTNNKIVFNPHTNEMLYNTGDTGCLMNTGNIEFLGRNDFQVKIRGYRIELQEIEHTILLMPDIKNCISTIYSDDAGNKRIASYIVLKSSSATISKNLIISFLKTKLPNYMIPDNFTFMESLPLSSNGKVDRKALPKPMLSTVGDTYFSANSFELLAEVKRILKNTLGLKDISDEDDFFDLGGNSLLAMRVYSQLQKFNGNNIPLSSLFQTPTPRGISNVITQSESADYSRLLIPLSKENLRPPMIFIHPIGGNILCYSSLARAIDSHYSVFALQAVGLSGDVEPLCTIESMAERYIEEILPLLPEPGTKWYLGGWSMGGVIAFEIASRLAKRQYSPEGLILIDSRLDEIEDYTLIDKETIAQWFVNDLTSGKMPKLTVQDTGQDSSADSLINRAVNLSLLPEGTSLEQLYHPFNIFNHNVTALSNYKPLSYSGNVTVILSKNNHATPICAKKWLSLTSGEAEIHYIDADHYQMMLPPYMEELARFIMNK